MLFFFGLCNAGVQLSSMGDATWLVLAGLLIGKPIGILTMGWLAAVPLRLGIPEGMRIVDLVVIGFVAAIGFTVSLFVASVAFDAGPVQDAAKWGRFSPLPQRSSRSFRARSSESKSATSRGDSPETTGNRHTSAGFCLILPNYCPRELLKTSAINNIEAKAPHRALNKTR